MYLLTYLHKSDLVKLCHHGIGFINIYKRKCGVFWEKYSTNHSDNTLRARNWILTRKNWNRFREKFIIQIEIKFWIKKTSTKTCPYICILLKIMYVKIGWRKRPREKTLHIVIDGKINYSVLGDWVFSDNLLPVC